MVEGPLGREIILLDDDKSVLVLIGIDGPNPPVDVRISLRESINTKINQALIDAGADISHNRSTVELTIEENPTPKQLEALGNRTLHVQQYEVETDLEEIPGRLIDAIHNDVVGKVKDLGFNITGTKTTVV